MVDEKIFEQKKILRKQMTSKRSELEKNERDKLSREIVKKLLSYEVYKNSKTVMAYASMPEEIQLQELFEDALSSKKILAVPFIVGRGNMRAVLLPSLDVLEKGDFGILTVRQENRKFVDAKEIDCVIVPGAAFDIRGNRLGLGGGYYDRFLKKISAKKIALAFDFQITKNLPIESHDVPVDFIFTEKNFFDVRKEF